MSTLTRNVTSQDSSGWFCHISTCCQNFGYIHSAWSSTRLPRSTRKQLSPLRTYFFIDETTFLLIFKYIQFSKYLSGTYMIDTKKEITMGSGVQGTMPEWYIIAHWCLYTRRCSHKVFLGFKGMKDEEVSKVFMEEEPCKILQKWHMFIMFSNLKKEYLTIQPPKNNQTF